MQPDLEHRVIVEVYTSSNSLTGTVYYNPERDRSVNLVHRSSLVYDSRYDRHVDHVYFYIGDYYQQNYGNNSTYGIGYQQEYDFTQKSYFTWRLSLESRIYDGEREQQTYFFASYAYKFL
jgi:hypothetical protein